MALVAGFILSAPTVYAAPLTIKQRIEVFSRASDTQLAESQVEYLPDGSFFVISAKDNKTLAFRKYSKSGALLSDEKILTVAYSSWSFPDSYDSLVLDSNRILFVWREVDETDEYVLVASVVDANGNYIIEKKVILTDLAFSGDHSALAKAANGGFALMSNWEMAKFDGDANLVVRREIIDGATVSDLGTDNDPNVIYDEYEDKYVVSWVEHTRRLFFPENQDCLEESKEAYKKNLSAFSQTLNSNFVFHVGFAELTQLVIRQYSEVALGFQSDGNYVAVWAELDCHAPVGPELSEEEKLYNEIFGNYRDFGTTYLQVFNVFGEPVSEKQAINLNKTVDFPKGLVVMPDNSIVVAWRSLTSGYETGSIKAYLRHFDHRGNPLADPVFLQEENFDLNIMSDESGRVMVAARTSGGKLEVILSDTEDTLSNQNGSESTADAATGGGGGGTVGLGQIAIFAMLMMVRSSKKMRTRLAAS